MYNFNNNSHHKINNIEIILGNINKLKENLLVKLTIKGFLKL